MLKELPEEGVKVMGRYERAFPELFALLPTERQRSVNAALNDDRLAGNDVQRAQVELLVRSVIDDMSDEEYLTEVMDFLGRG